MIDDLKIITGERKDVEKKVQAYLSNHPKAAILGTAVTFKPGEAIEQEPPKAPKTKDKDKAKEKAATEEAPEATTLVAVEYGPPTEWLAITVGKVV